MHGKNLTIFACWTIFGAMSLKSDRIEQLLSNLKTSGGSTVSELAESLNVTEITVRRYLNQLEKTNRVKLLNE